jgi:3-hydroxypropanoate dehydrogenase
MTDALPDATLARLFREARTHNAIGGEVGDDTLRALYDLVKFGPTEANACPARFVFVRSPEAKARLAPALSDGNRDKTLAAPVTVIVGHDMAFYDKLPVLFPHTDARAWFAGADEARLDRVGLRGSSMQTAYLILAARALGLDCGPMTGFDNAMVDAAFFAGTAVRSNILVNLGHGDPAQLFPRSPRLPFDEAARIE